jgi:hypothetical protein
MVGDDSSISMEICMYLCRCTTQMPVVQGSECFLLNLSAASKQCSAGASLITLYN